MRFEIVPEPGSEEREELEQALRRLLPAPPQPYSLWWREGVTENVEDGAGPDGPGDAAAREG